MPDFLKLLPRMPLLVLVAATFLSGGVTGATASAAEKNLRFRIKADPASLDWTLAHTTNETYVLMNVMEGLVEGGKNLRPQPALAERWEVSPDGKTYTFYLRKGVKWSDGRTLKASDFVDSWLRLLNPKSKAKYGNFLLDIENAESFYKGTLKTADTVGVKALGELKLQVRLRQPSTDFIHRLSFWVTFPIRADLIKKHGSTWTSPNKLVTLGPFKITEWTKGKTIRLVRYADYYGNELGMKPSIDKVEMTIEPDERKARELFEKDKLDFLLDATTGDLLKANAGSTTGTKTAKARVKQFPYLSTHYLGFNVSKPPFNNASIRRAVALAIDRSALPAVMQGGQIPAAGLIPPSLDGFDATSGIEGTLYDARGALMRAGYTEGQRFPKLTLWLDNFDGAEALSKYMVQALREKLGIEMDVHICQPAEFYQNVHEGHATIFVSHWGADFPDPINFYEIFSSTSKVNGTQWKNPAYDQLLKKARVTLNSEERLALYATAEKMLVQKEAVILPLFYKRNTALLSERVKEFYMSPLNDLFLKYVALE